MRVLAVNAGSTSVKVTLVDGDRRVVTYDGLAAARAAHEPVDAVAHRVVHGGARLSPELVDDRVRVELERLTELAPLHQPPALAAIDACRRTWPHVPHVACFDTAFHATIPPARRCYALPSPWRERLPVYGFHGLSHRWAALRVAERLPAVRRVLIAHLGGGASLCGVFEGRSVVTTMGYTPLDGLVMATRAGSVDPGAVLALVAAGVDAADLLDRRSGLLGLCGDDDLREVERRAADGDRVARFALDVYEERLVEQAGRCAAALGGLDAIAFTGGVGEHDTRLRSRVVERLAWLGGAEAPSVVVVASAEDLMMASDASEVVGAAGAG